MSADFALASIARRFGKEEAVEILMKAQAAEEVGDCDAAVKLYRQAYKLWDALDSRIEDDGLPRAVKLAAEAAGLSCTIELPMKTNASLRFDVTDADRWLGHLDEHGYCVIAGVADAAAVARAKTLIWDFLESVPGTQVRRDRLETWGLDGQWLPSGRNGIVGTLGFGQSDFCWHVRLLPGVARAFSAIWGCEDLIVSFDGGNIFRPWSQRPEWRTEGSWWHVDQNAFLPGMSGRVSIQGLVSFTDATSATGGLCVIPGSHKLHEQVCERACAKHMSGNFLPVQSGDPVLRNGGQLVCAEAGDLLLWDSRCVHCNTPGNCLDGDNTGSSAANDHVREGEDMELLRIVGYVSMLPATVATHDLLAKRRRAFLHNVTASHWPHDLGEEPIWPPPTRWSDASLSQRRLVVGASSSLLFDQDA
mmetsp:Transcript_104640/g.207819  ORF Transcript_104640/g.207819 Transcript_104640/m.207819 type:complete len:419 (+) Transcript_104640:41-1297(+)